MENLQNLWGGYSIDPFHPDIRNQYPCRRRSYSRRYGNSSLGNAHSLWTSIDGL